MRPAALPHTLPALGMFGRAALIAEILMAYPPALRRLRTNDLRMMVAAARRGGGSRPVSMPAELEHTLALRLGVGVLRTLKVLPTDGRCLIRSLVLTRLLSKRSISSVLVIGVQPGEAFGAHAWVEHDGRPVLPPGNFARLMEI